MFKKLVPLLCVSMLSVMPNSSFAGGPDFESLFGKNSSQQLVFNMCGGGDGELKDICRNLNSDLSYTFSSNHTLTITTPSREAVPSRRQVSIPSARDSTLQATARRAATSLP